ncbi:MAG: hypothetical protein D6812_06540 [Deltaproteobacteria bacterium]|nr:MAG: hypothetical protein D6812_06540 [Deltaproteobacteria bacterium]
MILHRTRSAFLAGILLVVSFLFLGPGCPGEGYEVVAHRGFSSQAPENTMAAYEAALAVGAHHFELDVHETADGELVCIHDDTLDRTTDCTGEVAEKTYEEIATCDAGSWFSEEFAGEPIPRLEDVLLRFAHEPIGIVIELKVGGVAGQVLDLIETSGKSENVHIVSFEKAWLEEAQGAMDGRVEIPLLWLLRVTTAGQIEEAAAAGFAGVDTHFSTTRQELVDLAHSLGMTFAVYTVDQPAVMAQMSRLGVDLLTTNVPDVALEQLP